jgi:hypothetical protein
MLTTLFERFRARWNRPAAAVVLLCIVVSGAAIPEVLAAGAVWSSPTAISTTNQPDPTRGSQLNAVAVNASGLTIAAWDQFTYNAGGGATIGAAVQSGGRWSASFTISGTTGYSMTPRVAVGANGTMAVSWIYEDPVATTVLPQQKVQVAVKPAGASAWTTYTLAGHEIGGVDVTNFVPIGIDDAGNVTAAWSLWDGAKHVVQAATLMNGASAWLPAETLSGAADGLYIDLAVNGLGDAAVVYSLSPYSSYLTGTNVQFASRSGAAGAWTTAAAISETMQSSVGYVTNPRVALDARGLATVIYFGYGVEATRQSAVDRSWCPANTVLAAPNAVSSFQSVDLAVDGAGNAIVAASIFDATVGVDRASVWVTRSTPKGMWTAEQRITDPTVPVDAYATRVAVSPDGAAAVVGWIDHYHGAVQVTHFDAAAGTWGAARTIGRGTAFSSFQEVLSVDVASGSVARAIWKGTAKGGTRTMAASYK